MKWLRCCLLAATIALTLMSAIAARAQSHPNAQRELSRGAVSLPVREPKRERAMHNIFGTMGAIGPRRFLLRTRSGRIIVVDDTQALARGTYSAPLFRGKIVLVSGSYDRNRVFTATSVSRFNSLDNQTPPDN